MINNLFLSVGAMKAGTTWLYERLKDHPEVNFTPEKEIHYFANKVGIENQLSYRNRVLKLKGVLEKYHNGNAKYISENLDEIAWYIKFANTEVINNDWYISLFGKINPESYAADFSNLYCQMDNKGWNNVNKVSRQTKVIYTLRDPMKRLWSHYKFHHKWIGKEDSVIDDGFTLFKETLSKPWFINNANYAINLDKIYNGVGKDNVLMLYFEDFRVNPQSEANKITKFLNIEDIVIPESSNNKRVNATKDFDMPDEWQEYAKNSLDTYVERMRNKGIWHSSWEF